MLVAASTTAGSGHTAAVAMAVPRASASATPACTSSSCGRRAARCSRCAGARAPIPPSRSYPRVPVLACPGHEPRWDGDALAAAVAARRAGVAAAVALAAGGGDDGGARGSALRPSLLARTEVAAARVGAASTSSAASCLRSGATTAAVERYDLRRDRWSRARGLPVALNHAAAAAWRGRALRRRRLPRADGLAGESAALLRYDPRARPLGAPARHADAARRAGRGRRSATACTRPAARPAAARCGRWRSSTCAAAAGAAGPPCRRRASTWPAPCTAARFYALAGRAAGQGNFTVAERYRARAAGAGSACPTMRKPRGGIAAAAAGGRIVVVGGEEAAGTIAEVEAYDPRAGAGARCPTCRRRATASARSPTAAACYVLEGGTSPGFTFSSAIERLVLSAARRASSSYGLSR